MDEKLGPLLAVSDLCAYVQGFQVIDGIDFDVKASKIVGITGSKGAGVSRVMLLKATVDVLYPEPLERCRERFDTLDERIRKSGQ